MCTWDINANLHYRYAIRLICVQHKCVCSSIPIPDARRFDPDLLPRAQMLVQHNQHILSVYVQVFAHDALNYMEDIPKFNTIRTSATHKLSGDRLAMSNCQAIGRSSSGMPFQLNLRNSPIQPLD
jgi:hypothetical protein